MSERKVGKITRYSAAAAASLMGLSGCTQTIEGNPSAAPSHTSKAAESCEEYDPKNRGSTLGIGVQSDTHEENIRPDKEGTIEFTNTWDFYLGYAEGNLQGWIEEGSTIEVAVSVGNMMMANDIDTAAWLRDTAAGPSDTGEFNRSNRYNYIPDKENNELASASPRDQTVFYFTAVGPPSDCKV